MEITGRLIVDNASFTGGAVLLTGAACAHYGLDTVEVVEKIGLSLSLLLLFIYVHDTANQIKGAREDAVNKPHRPIPSGLLTRQDMAHRLWIGMVIYTILGWTLGVLAWVLLWQFTVILQNFVFPPRYYVLSKLVCMVSAAVVQLAVSWQIAGPIDTIGWTWIWVIALAFNVALPFEDLRDMAGDAKIGRRSLPLIIGHWPVRIEFAVVMTALPMVLYLLLFAATPAQSMAQLVCALGVAVASWLGAARGLLLRTPAADRTTYLAVHTYLRRLLGLRRRPSVAQSAVSNSDLTLPFREPGKVPRVGITASRLDA